MKKPIAALTLLLCVAAIGWLTVHLGSDWHSDRAATPSSPSIPVVADFARNADVPIYLSGLGTVQAFNSVLVKSRVDGQILKIDFAEGQEVHAGDVVAEVDPRPYAAALAQAQAAKLKDQAQLENARADFSRSRQLAVTAAVSKQQEDTARSLVAQLEASVSADQAQIDLAQLQLNYSSIRSPIDGRAGTRLIDAGNIVRTTDTTGIVTINQIRPISVNFALPAVTFPKVRARLKQGAIKVFAKDGNGRDLASGELVVIDNQISPATATIAYKATFDNADETLWPGQFVNIRLLLGVERNALTVPLTAVVRGPEGTYAFVIGADRVVQKRPIKIGFTNKTIAIVNNGLVAGEQVVTDGQYRIQAGNRAEIVESPAAPRDSGPFRASQ